MRIPTALALAAGLALAGATSALACSWEKQVTAQSPMPEPSDQQTASSTAADAAPTTAVAAESAPQTAADPTREEAVELAQTAGGPVKAN